MSVTSSAAVTPYLAAPLRTAAASDQNSLKFGTSGLRGLVTDLVGLPARAYSLAFVRHVLDLQPKTTEVLVGQDLRSSSPEIAKDCMAAIRQAGLQAIHCGALPTPALALEAQRRKCAAIMVTGSHIPDDRNGLKFYLAEGEITKADEAAILCMHAELDEETLASLSKSSGEATSSAPDAVLRYIDRYVAFFGADCLAGRRIAIYEHSSVARDVLAHLLRSLGADVAPVGRADRFIPVDTEAHEPEQIAYIESIARSGPFDAIVSTDGDADRPLVADERGKILRGDVLGLLSAKLLGMRTIVTPVTSGSVIERSGFGERVIRTRVGSPYVIAAMEEASKTGFRDIIGFEANGGTLLFSSAIGHDARRLEALPTRDAVLPILAALITVVRSGLPLSMLVDQLKVGHALADRLKDVPSSQSSVFLQELAGQGGFAARYFAEVGQISTISDLDGLRVEFMDGAVIHYRASGNAPELRCYVEAQEESRALDLLNWGLDAARHELARKGHMPI